LVYNRLIVIYQNNLQEIKGVIMDLIKRENLKEKQLLGRHLWRALGDDACFNDEVSVGFALFSLSSGKMKPHKHEREIIYVIGAKGASARFGKSKEKMDDVLALNPGDLLRFHEGEWHIFEMEDKNSYLEIMWMFSKPMNNTVE
jgi:hypothetical protein